jgi:hypothetical protein
MASAIIQRNPNKFVLFFAHRGELVFQPRDSSFVSKPREKYRI